MKSTPSLCLLHSCDELPLHIKHKLLCLNYKTHLLTFPHQPTLPLITDSRHEVHPDAPTFQSFNLYIKHAILQDHLNVNVLDAPHIQPWLLLRAHFDLFMTHLPYLQNPHVTGPYLQNPHVTVTTVLSHLHDNYSDLMQVYTDASKTTHRTGSGIYIPEYNIQKTIKINRHSSVLTSELHAILSALYWLTRSNLRGALIISNSLSAINSIRHATWNKHDLVNKIFCLNHVLLQRGTRVVHIRIPAHRVIPGNDTADTLARLPTIHGPSPTNVVYKKALNKLSLSEHQYQSTGDNYGMTNIQLPIKQRITNNFSQISTKDCNTPSLPRSSVYVLTTANSTDISTNSDYIWTVTVIRVAFRKLFNTF